MTGYVIRAASPDDSAALYVLHRAAMGPYIEAIYGPWDERVQAAFHAAWFDATRVSVIEGRGGLIGVLDCSWHADRLDLHRIAVDPRYQGQGIGTSVLTELLTRADQRGLPTRLQVFDINPARRLYERLGFVQVGGTGHEVHMSRSPRPSAPLRPTPRDAPNGDKARRSRDDLDTSSRRVRFARAALVLFAAVAGWLIGPVDASGLLAVALPAAVVGMLAIGAVIAPTGSSFHGGTKLWHNGRNPGGGGGA